MSTIRQQALAAAIVENVENGLPLNKTEILESIGYSHATAIGEAKVIIEAKGVQEELEKLGFSTFQAKKRIGEILSDKYAEQKDIINAAKLVFQVQGDLAPEKHLIVNKNISLDV